MNQAINAIKTMMMVEYRELTAPLGRLRSFIPLMIIGFITTAFFGLFLLIDSMFSLFNVTATVELNDETIILVAFVVTLETFLSFFLPITVPMSRFSMEGREFDLLLSLPVKHWHVLLGIFLAEAILSLPLFILTGTGSIFLLTYLFFQDLTFTLEISILSFFLLFLLSTVSLWLGLLVTRFLTQAKPSNITKPAFNLMLSLVAILLILLVDSVSRGGKNALQTGWLQFLPPTQASILIMNALLARKVNLVFDFPILLAFLVELFLILTVTTVIAIKINLQPSNIAVRSPLRMNTLPLITRVPERFTIDWILFKRFLRDTENMSRLVLSIVLSLTILFLFQKFIIINVPVTQENAELIELLIEAVTIFGFLGMISIIAFLESSFFAMEARENIFLFLTIPKSLRTLMTKKLLQISLQVSVITTIITLIGWSWQLLPDDPLTTWLTLMLLGIPITLILLGIYQLNPPSDEQDVTHLFNAFIFFVFLIACQFFIFFLVMWLQASRLVIVLILSFFLLLIGTLTFALGLHNLEQYDLGEGTGPLTGFFRSFVKLTGLFITIHFTAILMSILSLHLTGIIAAFIIGFYVPYIVASLVLFYANKRENGTPRELKDQLESLRLRKITVQVLGISIFGILLTLLFPSPLLEIVPNARIFKELTESIQVGNLESFIYQVIIISLEVIALLIFVVVVEEMFFRKTIIEQLQKEGFSPLLVLGISALFFAFAHASVFFASVITTFLLGIVLARIYYKQRSIKPCILIHLYYNVLIAAIVLFLTVLS